MFAFYCPICRYRQNVPITLAGKRTACPGCKRIVPLPNRTTIQEESIDYNFCDEEEKSPSKRIA